MHVKVNYLTHAEQPVAHISLKEGLIISLRSISGGGTLKNVEHLSSASPSAMRPGLEDAKQLFNL